MVRGKKKITTKETRMIINPTFDCHGKTYQQVMDEFENWLWLNQNHTPLEVVTGSSSKMKMIITRLLEHNEMQYAIPAHNHGMVIIL